MSIAIKANLVLLLFFSWFFIQAQPTKPKVGDYSNHVVIGAFGNIENAVQLVNSTKEAYPDIALEINPLRQLNYVYVLKTDDRVQAFALARKLRKESKFFDTWVFYGVLGQDLSVSQDKTMSSRAAASSSIASNGTVTGINSQQDLKLAEEVKAYSISEESSGLDLNTAIEKAVDSNEKMHYEAIKSVKAKAFGLDATTKVIVFKDDKEGREALRSLGYNIEEGKPVGGFFDSKNNILAINASESKTDEPFHEGLRPVVKFLKKKNPELFEQLARQAAAIKHPAKVKTYGELAGTPEEALGNMLADVKAGLFDNADQPRGEAKSLIGKILQALGVEPPEIAISSQHLKATANNLAIAVREATGFDADGNRKFKFDIFNTVDRRKVEGGVDIVTEAGRKLISYQGNELIQVKRKDVSGEIILSCEIFGYRKLLFKLNYDNPFLTDGVQKGEDEEAIIPFGLVRLQKGDIAVMYNVLFFQDAAIIRPESKYEINNLLSMLNESDSYKIRIHGHTNGNASGKIITMGESKNYFSLSGTKEGRGSAKDLSEKRAEVIKEYLIDNGISVGRMEIKAWGGKRPLYDKNDNQARANVRVEIEILEN
jgi:outer membrane protein OmpA-like peptidoglycan-associated protein